jgi:long-chain acyl-CoA synthetase
MPPADLEQALAGSPLVEQALIVGDGRPYLAALLVPAPGALEALARGLGLDMENGDLRHHPAIERALLDRLQPELRTFPGYAKLVRVAIADGPWSTENGLMTPTLKLRRAAILRRYRADLERLYDGH